MAGQSQDEETNTEQYNAWQTIQRSHAVANGVHVVSVNRVGFEQNGAMKFWGGSFVSNPFGTVLYKASHDKEEVICCRKLTLKKQTATELIGHFFAIDELIPISR